MNDPLGVSPGSVSEASFGDLRNDYPVIRDVPVDPETDRVQPRQIGTGTMRGTQKIISTDGSYVTIGLVPDGSNDFGIAYFDANDRLVAKNTGSTDYKYDLATGKNYYQNGKLPDGSYGAIFVKTNVDVADVVV